MAPCQDTHQGTRLTDQVGDASTWQVGANKPHATYFGIVEASADDLSDNVDVAVVLVHCHRLRLTRMRGKYHAPEPRSSATDIQRHDIIQIRRRKHPKSATKTHT
eukprot:3098880-Rhodomonas_salina.5